MAFGSTLGQVLVSVGVDTKQLQAGMARAKGEVSSAGTTMSKFGTYAAAGFAIAGVAAVKFAADAVKSAQEHEAALTRLRIAIGGSTAAFESQATALQNLTGYQDESILLADAALSRFKLTEAQIHQTIPLILDYATATGVDAEQAAASFGRALLGNARGMKTLGIQFSATGDRTKDLGVLTDKLRSKVEGTAVALGQTFAGQVAIFGAKLDDVKENIGAGLLPVLTDLVGAGQDVIEIFSGLSVGAGGASDGFRILANAITFGLYEPSLAALHELNLRLNGVATTVTMKMTPALRALTQEFASTHDGVANFAHMSDIKLKAWSKDTVQTMTVAMSSLSSVGKLFDLTADQMVRATQRVAGQQQRIANDLKKLFNLKGVSDQMKRDIADAGPEAVDAFVRGSRGQKAKILDAFRDYHEALKETKSQLKPEALTGGKEVGKALTDGMRSGIVIGSPQVAAAARTAVLDAIAAAKRAAGVASPSVVFRAIGRDMVKGLVIGIIEATPEAEKAMQKIVDRFKSFFDALKGRFDSFKQSIAGGIAGFKDLFGAVGGLFGQTDAEGNPIQVTGDAIAAAVQSQVAQAQELARVLKELAAKGLNQQLLAQLAGQGAAAIPEAQALLADPTLIATMNEAYAAITRAAQSTADKLGDRFFGNAIDRAKDRMDMLSEALRALTHAVNQTTNITVNVQGAIMAEADLMRQIRQAAQQGAARNAFSTGF